MPYRRHTITVATSALFFVCLMLHAQANPNSQTLLPYNDAEAYKVYEALLPTDWTVTVAHARRLLIQAQTGSGPNFCLKPDPESAALLQPVFDSLVALSKTAWLLQPNFGLSTPYEFASSEDLQAFFKPNFGDWKGFAERYPDSAHSYVTLSPIAFNADKTIAVVYMGHSCGSLCGGGTFYVLENKEGVWKNLRWKGTSCGWAS
ncbi:hypothetical protein [Granulicella sp. L60]|uniref:hypothetical protein n=1 Tax=Granulicella sp. L60 TaxID=1641866 RepID=UPI00131DA08E|nr:hypothetical protein [Granulicella sp. L60]